MGFGIHHDYLAGYNSDKHVAHSGVSITGAGLLAGQGGNITASRVFTLNNSDIDHNSLNNYSANAHVLSLTSGRIPFVGASGQLVDSSVFKYTTGTTLLEVPNITASGLTTTNTLSITAPSGGTYKFLDGVYLAIQNQSDGSARINLHTLAADEGDVIGIQMFSKGGPGETTNYSQLQMVFITGATPYWRIGTTQGGTLPDGGKVLPLKLFSTTTYLNQLVLDTNGSVGINNASPSSSYKLDVNGSIQAVSTVNAGSYAVGGSLGATGTFTTVDGKTVTASGGLIVSIV